MELGLLTNLWNNPAKPNSLCIQEMNHSIQTVIWYEAWTFCPYELPDYRDIQKLLSLIFYAQSSFSIISRPSLPPLLSVTMYFYSSLKFSSSVANFPCLAVCSVSKLNLVWNQLLMCLYYQDMEIVAWPNYDQKFTNVYYGSSIIIPDNTYLFKHLYLAVVFHTNSRLLPSAQFFLLWDSINDKQNITIFPYLLMLC